jgi:hypothetical protein
VARKFLCALILLDLVNETPVSEVVTRYNMKRQGFRGGRGDVQNLQDKAARFASQVRSIRQGGLGFGV